MAVELCKVGLWLETLEPGKPLSFLDANIQCGNSLIGATPALLAGGIPDEAFTPIEGDDKAYCSEFKKRNKEEREGQQRCSTAPCSPGTAWATSPRHAEPGRLPRRHDGGRAGEAGAYERAGRARATTSTAGCGPTPGARLSSGRRRRSSPTRSPRRSSARSRRTRTTCAGGCATRSGDCGAVSVLPLAPGLPARVPRAGNGRERDENEQTGWSGGFRCGARQPTVGAGIKLQEKELFAARLPDIAVAETRARRKRADDRRRSWRSRASVL